MAQKRVVVMHGSWPRVPLSFERDVWPAAIRDLCEARGAKVIADASPPGDDIDESGQIAHLAALVGEPDEHTYIVSISMANHVAMRYLQSLAVQGKKFGGWVTLAGWFTAAIMKGRGDFGPRGAPPGMFGDLGDFSTVVGAKVYQAIDGNHCMVQGLKDPIVQMDQTYNLSLWRQVFGDGLRCVIHDFVDGTTELGEGTVQPMEIPEPVLWKDHLIGITEIPEVVLSEVTAIVFGD